MSSISFDPNTTPALNPPDGVDSNFIDPESRAYILRNVIYAFLPLVPIFLALRLYSRAIIVRNVGIDDWLAILAAASIPATCGALLSLIDGPMGRHMWDIPISALTDVFHKTVFAVVHLTIVSTTLVKLTLLFLYLRIFNADRAVKITIYSCLVVVVLFYMATMAADLVVGLPREGKGWLQAQNEAVTFQLHVAAVSGVFGFVSDLVILLIPISQIVGLALPKRRKAMLVCIFLTGLLACISSLLSCVHRFRGLHNPDNTWGEIPAITAVTIELIVGFVCSCLPTIPPVVLAVCRTRVFTSIRSYLKSTGPSANNGEPRPTDGSGGVRNELPSMPRANLAGLRSFIRGSGAYLSRITKSRGIAGDSGHDNLDSIDMDYHAQLKHANQDTESTRGLQRAQDCGV